MPRPTLRVPELVQCPHCQEWNPVVEERCRACNGTLAIYIGPPKPIRQVHLGSLMVLVAVAALSFALMRASVGLGVCCLAWLTPSLARTFYARARRKADSRPLTGPEVVGEFVTSSAIVMVIAVVAGTAGAAAGFAGFWIGAGAGLLFDGGTGFQAMTWGAAAGLSLGAVAAVAAAVFLVRRLWAPEP